MPLHYGGKTYKTFQSTVRAIRRDNPSWSMDRAERYAGALESVQRKRKKTSRKYKGFTIRPMPSHINKGRGYIVDGVGSFTTIAAAKREIDRL